MRVCVRGGGRRNAYAEIYQRLVNQVEDRGWVLKEIGEKEKGKRGLVPYVQRESEEKRSVVV